MLIIFEVYNKDITVFFWCLHFLLTSKKSERWSDALKLIEYLLYNLRGGASCFTLGTGFQ